jgi:predicted ATPase
MAITRFASRSEGNKRRPPFPAISGFRPGRGVPATSPAAAATSLARLWRDQGKGGASARLVAPVYGWFTEGFDTRDLKEAKGLLNALA